jgi:hypothetical protein
MGPAWTSETLVSYHTAWSQLRRSRLETSLPREPQNLLLPILISPSKPVQDYHLETGHDRFLLTLFDAIMTSVVDSHGKREEGSDIEISGVILRLEIAGNKICCLGYIPLSSVECCNARPDPVIVPTIVRQTIPILRNVTQQIKEDWMDGTCSTHAADEKYIRNFNPKY